MNPPSGEEHLGRFEVDEIISMRKVSTILKIYLSDPAHIFVMTKPFLYNNCKVTFTPHPLGGPVNFIHLPHTFNMKPGK